MQHQETLPTGAGRAKALWLLLHIGLAAFLIPLVLVHVWAVFAFKLN